MIWILICRCRNDVFEVGQGLIVVRLGKERTFVVLNICEGKKNIVEEVRKVCSKNCRLTNLYQLSIDRIMLLSI